MVLYEMPVAGLEEWMKKPEADRKSEEDGLKAEWDAWLAAHASAVMNTVSVGKTKRVSAGGVEDAKNDIMLSSYAQGESAEAVADAFKDHPHLKIPGATIEIMEVKPMTA